MTEMRNKPEEKFIPKAVIFDVMKEIDSAVIAAPVKIGDVVIEDVAGTGVQVVATRKDL